MQALPIDAILPDIIRFLRDSPNLVIEAPPGAGKTTRVPPALLDAGVAGTGEVWVLEPRRLAARLSAGRVAEERGERLGETIGYQIRFEEVASPRTRLRFLTEGVLTRRLLHDPQLSGVNAIILDEFHERHLQADLALALLRRLQREGRPGLRIIAMSATLDAAPVAGFLDDCLVLRSEGRRFEVAVEHLARPDDRPLEVQIEEAASRLVADKLDGDVLVFLPGATEIRRAQEACSRLASESDLLIVPLHGELPAAEQDRAVRPAGQRKIILSTNVAETSVTIEGVVAVIDSGLARIAGYSPWSGLPTLNTGRISQASAAQRAGRAGRTRPGKCLRLYTWQDFAARPTHETPEIKRLDLAEPALELHAAGITDLSNFEWFEPPSPDALRAAETLLERLGAVDRTGRVTTSGSRMLRLPLHPRLARVVVEAESRGVAREGCLVAALASERDIRAGNIMLDSRRRQRSLTHASGPSDLLELADLFAEAEKTNFAPEQLRLMNLDPNRVRAVDRVRRQLERLCGSKQSQVKGETKERDSSSDRESELLISILTGYPDRVAHRRRSAKEAQQAEDELLIAGGGAATLSPESVVRRAEFLVAVDAEERRASSGKRGGRTVVRLASAIEPEWLLDFFTDRIDETTEVEWNAQGERVEVVERLVYDGLVLNERRLNEAVNSAETSAKVTRVLADAAQSAGVQAFVDGETIDRFLTRVEFMARTIAEADFPVLSEDDVRAALIRLCEGKHSFVELREAARGGGLMNELRQKLSHEQLRMLGAMAPERVTLAGGRQVKVNYERRQAPWVASRLQDFFGMREGPKIADGRIAVVLHLLAPNGRPVQVTEDLTGFWARYYSQVRRELGRRYPRHAWPENPLQNLPERS